MNNGGILIEYRDGEVCLFKSDHQETEHFYDEITIPNIHDDLIGQAFDNKN